MKIDDMPVMQGPSTTPPKLKPPTRVRPPRRSTPPQPTRRPDPDPPQSSAPESESRAWKWLKRLFVGIALISFFGMFAPKPVHKKVPPSTIKPGGAVRNPCGTHGKVVKAVEFNDAGPYPIYQVTCTDGITLPVAQ